MIDTSTGRDWHYTRGQQRNPEQAGGVQDFWVSNNTEFWDFRRYLGFITISARFQVTLAKLGGIQISGFQMDL